MTAKTQRPPATETYRAIRFSTHPVGRDRLLLFSRELERVLDVDANIARVLSMCQGCKSLDEHATAVSRSGAVGDLPRLRSTLAALVEGEVLRRCSDFVPMATTSSRSLEREPIKPISTIGIITADRPAALRRCLESIVHHCECYGNRPRIVVVDGSLLEENLVANRCTTSNLSEKSGYDSQYVGKVEAANLRRVLRATGAPESTLQFGLSPGTIGSNRNLLLLLTAGEHFLTVDDDIVCETWALPSRQHGIVLAGHVDLRARDFFATRAAALSTATPAAVDLLAAHCTLLGQSLSDLISASSESPDMQHGCGHMFEALLESTPMIVRATFAGVAGDSGIYCPYRLLFSSGPARSALVSNPIRYEMALKSRETLRIATRNLITHEPFCMALCMALSNTSLLPPFSPAGRNSDGVFGRMLAVCDPASVFGHIPYGIIHDSDRPSEYHGSTMISATQTRVSDLLLSFVRSLASMTPSTSPIVRMQRLGQSLMEFAELEVQDFIAFVTRATLEWRTRELADADKVFLSSGCQHHWRSGVDQYRAICLKSMTDPAFFLPIEFHSAESIQDGYRALQSFLKNFGEFVMVWPTLLQSAEGLGLSHNVD